MDKNKKDALLEALVPGISGAVQSPMWAGGHLVGPAVPPPNIQELELLREMQRGTLGLNSPAATLGHTLPGSLPGTFPERLRGRRRSQNVQDRYPDLSPDEIELLIRSAE